MLTDHAELDQSRHNATRPGEMRREVHTSVQTPQPRSAVAPLMQTALSCGESLFRHPASSFVSVGLPLLPFQERDLLRPGRRSWPSCRALSFARERMLLEAAAHTRGMQMNTPSRYRHPRGPSIPAHGSSFKQAVEPAILTPAEPAPQWRSKSAGCALKATPAAGPLSSKSTLLTSPLQWRCGGSTAIATSALSKSQALSYSNSSPSL